MKTRFHDRADEIVGLRIHGVVLVVHEDYFDTSYEEDNENPDAFGVYLILKDGLLEHIGDFPTIELAEFMAYAVTLSLDVPIENRIKK